MNSETAHEKILQLKQKIGEVKDINNATALLHWDQEVYMPPKGAAARGQQLATLSSLAHRLFTDPEMGRRLQELDEEKDKLSEDEAKLVSETLYDYQRATKLPESFVHVFSIEQSKAYEAWVKARKESKFSLFQPHLEKIVQLLRQKADLMGYEGTPYNALLEDYERGTRAEALKDLFKQLAAEQSALVEEIVNSPNQPETKWVDRTWDPQKQWEFTMRVVKDLGYDMEAGRQDISVHPFSTSFDVQDVRITTRLNEKELFSALTGSIHETGHALYEQGLRPEDSRTTLGEAISLGIHESQSRMWENMIGRSLPFWKHYTQPLQAVFPEPLAEITAEKIYRAINRVQPSFIRVEADECTYNLHVILRFEIEMALFGGQIHVEQVPELWNVKMKDYLGLDVPNDAMGCLQDIHWSHGSLGYFPTYTLGNLYAAQMFEKIVQDMPDLWGQVEQGQFSGLLGWLREKVHRVGRRMTAPELIQSVTGKQLSSEPYLRYLRTKYGELYGLKNE